jgi:hypothetical protein
MKVHKFCVAKMTSTSRTEQRNDILLHNNAHMAPTEMILISTLKTKPTIKCLRQLVFKCQTRLRSGDGSISYKKRYRRPKVAWAKYRILRYNNL